MGHTYRVTEVVGTSTESIDAAVRSAVKRADETLRNLDWFEVGEIRGRINQNGVECFQVSVKLGFKLEDAD